MRVNFGKNVARAVTGGAAVALCLGSAQAAMAKPAPPAISVPCSAGALAGAVAGAVSGDTLVLTKFCTYQMDAALVIGVDLTIQGNESTVERSYFHGTPDFSVFVVTSGVSFELDNVNVRNGNTAGSSLTDSSDGGAIDNVDGSVTVHGGTFSGNSASDEGGAIYNGGGLFVSGAVFTGNHAGDVGGAVGADTKDLGTIIRAGTFNDEEFSTVLVGDSFAKNTSDYGGGVYIDSPTLVSHCNFTGNSAIDYGGGIYDEGGSPVVTASGFYQNQASWGGGIYNDDVITVTGTSFHLNKAADEGGGFYNDDEATLHGGAFTANTAEYGGGMYNEDSENATLNGTTFSNNTASIDGGGYYNFGDTTFNHGQVTRNTAAHDGGGIFNDGGGVVTLNGTPVTDNHPDNCVPVNSISGCTG